MRRPWFPLYVSDWLFDTATLTYEEQGVYFRLLCFQWRLGALRYEDLPRLLGLSVSEVGGIWPTIRDHFELNAETNRWANARLEVERQRSKEFSELQAAKGRRSGMVRRRNRRTYRGSTDEEPQLNQPQSQSQSHTQVQIQSQPQSQTKALVVASDDARSNKYLAAVEPQLVTVRGKTAKRRTVEQALDLAVEVVFRYWRDSMGFNPKTTINGPHRQQRIQARLRENGGDVSELLYAIDGALKDDWLMGRKAQSDRKYNDVHHILRDREQVERLRDLVRSRQEQHPFLANGDVGARG